MIDLIYNEPFSPDPKESSKQINILSPKKSLDPETNGILVGGNIVENRPYGICLDNNYPFDNKMSSSMGKGENLP